MKPGIFGLAMGLMLFSSVTEAQTQYSGRASSTATRTEMYRRGSLPAPSLGSAGAETPHAPRPTTVPTVPRSSLGRTYRSPLTQNRTPDAPALPHTARQVAPQSYKSEFSGTSAASPMRR